MATQQPEPITATEHHHRLHRITQIARRYGFVGRIDYRHVLSNAGGAQFGLGSSPARDLLIVYAEAFLRDADLEDFSLEALLAHECGHQIVYRNVAWRRFLPGPMSPVVEEVLASVAGSVLATHPVDRENLVLKAVHDAVQCGFDLDDAGQLVFELRRRLEKTR
ncbi:MAG: hypothetical protein NTY19_43215, partial [Planctomycetota bacterium]|nr:hypothetical protein [Planctomycetota bacterium]